jgi:hypothetical protein
MAHHTRGLVDSPLDEGVGLSEIFPTRLRGSGAGFTHNFGRGMGSFFPSLVGFVSTRMALSTAVACFAIAAYGLLLFAALALPETRGRELDSLP